MGPRPKSEPRAGIATTRRRSAARARAGAGHLRRGRRVHDRSDGHRHRCHVVLDQHTEGAARSRRCSARGRCLAPRPARQGGDRGTPRRREQDGYTTAGGGCVTGSVCVTAVPNPTRDIQLDTSVSAPVPTFFMRIFGINSIQATRQAKAEYVLPVPMGSPLNYFGAFGALRGGWIQTDTGWLYPTRTHLRDREPRRSLAHVDYRRRNAYLDESPDPALDTTTANVTDAQGFARFRSPEGGSPSIADFGIAPAGCTVPVGRWHRGRREGVVIRRVRLHVAGGGVVHYADLGATATPWHGIPNVSDRQSGRRSRPRPPNTSSAATPPPFCE